MRERFYKREVFSVRLDSQADSATLSRIILQAGSYACFSLPLIEIPVLGDNFFSY
jgi:hypothetical protein